MSRDLSLKDLSACVKDGRGPLWVDIDTTARQQLALLEKVFGFHPLAIEDVLNPSSRAKVEAYDGYLFVILRAVRLDQETPDPYDLETENVHFFIGSNVLVTAHSGPSKLVDSVAELLIRNGDLIGRGPGRLAHQLMEACFRHGLLILTCGASTVRFCPPLVVTEAQIDEAMTIFEEVLRHQLAM